MKKQHLLITLLFLSAQTVYILPSSRPTLVRTYLNHLAQLISTGRNMEARKELMTPPAQISELKQVLSDDPQERAEAILQFWCIDQTGVDREAVVSLLTIQKWAQGKQMTPNQAKTVAKLISLAESKYESA
ncbi:hypothetical protein HN446_00995 [bacterium]|jgi:hypothetical protein|nr:hypothetical protein [bacterium]